MNSNIPNTTSMPIDPRMWTLSEKIQFLAGRSHTCEKSARRFLRGEVIKGSAGERLRIAARELGLAPSPSMARAA